MPEPALSISWAPVRLGQVADTIEHPINVASRPTKAPVSIHRRRAVINESRGNKTPGQSRGSQGIEGIYHHKLSG